MDQTAGFAGSTAIVTGAGSGIGRATALRLAREGARVIAADVAAERLDALVAEEPGLDIMPVAGDITREEDVQRIVAAAEGRVDVLANVAGIMDGFVPAGEVEDDLWDLVFAINVTAVMRLTSAVLPLMVAAGRGSIVNVASEASFRGSAAGVAYTASKHAVVGFTKSTAVIYGKQGIRCNAVAPGPTITAASRNRDSQLALSVLGPLMQAMVPAPVEADEMANSLAWLAGDQSRNINGVVLASDAGWAAI